jgi:hypothetical protein
MPRKAIDDWLPYLEEVLAFWTQLGDDFTAAGLTRTQVGALRDQLKSTLASLDALQAQVGFTMGQRDWEISELDEFAVKLRAAVIGRYGPDSVEAQRCPKATPARRPPQEPPPTANI